MQLCRLGLAANCSASTFVSHLQGCCLRLATSPSSLGQETPADECHSSICFLFFLQRKDDQNTVEALAKSTQQFPWRHKLQLKPINGKWPCRLVAWMWNCFRNVLKLWYLCNICVMVCMCLQVLNLCNLCNLCS